MPQRHHPARRRDSGIRQPQHGGQRWPDIGQHKQPPAADGNVGWRTGQRRPYGGLHVARPSDAQATGYLCYRHRNVSDDATLATQPRVVR